MNWSALPRNRYLFCHHLLGPCYVPNSMWRVGHPEINAAHSLLPKKQIGQKTEIKKQNKNQNTKNQNVLSRLVTREQQWIFKHLRTLIIKKPHQKFLWEVSRTPIGVLLILLRTICQLVYNCLQGPQCLCFQGWQQIFPLRVDLTWQKNQPFGVRFD